MNASDYPPTETKFEESNVPFSGGTLPYHDAVSPSAATACYALWHGGSTRIQSSRISLALPVVYACAGHCRNTTQTPVLSSSENSSAPQGLFVTRGRFG